MGTTGKAAPARFIQLISHGESGAPAAAPTAAATAAPTATPKAKAPKPREMHHQLWPLPLHLGGDHELAEK